MKKLSLVLLCVILLAIPLNVYATIDTMPFASFGNDAVTVTFDYNRISGDVKRFTCTNDSDYNAWFGIYLMDYEAGTEQLVYEKVCGAHSVVIQVCAGTTIEWDTVDGGIMMENYQFRARWPSG